MNNCKYTIEWQCNRIELKNIKDLKLKLNYAEEVFMKFLNRKSDSVYSVLNWLGGLALGYKELKEKNAVKNLHKELSSLVREDAGFKKEKLSTVEDIKKVSNKSLLKQVLSDNLDRDLKWLSEYYIHRDLNDFIDNLVEVLGPNEKWYKKEELMKKCEGQKSQHIFLY